MRNSPHHALRDAAELAPSGRLKLGKILLDLSETEQGLPEDVQTAWDEEIDRRLQELRTGKTKGVPLDEVKRGIEAIFQK